MARDHARVQVSIWGDDNFRDLSPAAQHLYFLILTSPSLSYCGVADWRPSRILPLAAGWEHDDLDRAAGELARKLYLVVDQDTEEVLIRSFVRNDGLMKQPKMAVAMTRAYDAVASRGIRKVVIHELQRLREDAPELNGWGSDQARELLGNPSVNPSTYPTGYPSVNPSGKGKPTLNPNPSVKGCPTPSPTPAPTPHSFTPSPTPEGGYVSAVPHQGEPGNPPPPTCSKHPDGTDSACRACGDARKRREAWEAEADRASREAQAEARRQAAADRQAERDACDLCDDSGYAGARVCDHNPDRDAINERGMAKIREARAGLTRPRRTA